MEHEVSLRRGEVLEFVSTDASYVVHIKPNLRLDIARVSNFRVDTEHPGIHWAYMWLQTVQGFFVLRQLVIRNRPAAWELLYEVTPAEFSSGFFPWLGDHFEELIQTWNDRFGEGSLAAMGIPLEGGD